MTTIELTKIDEFDLAFVVDTTGSMGHLIKAAQRQTIAIIEALRQSADVDMQLGVVEYRDHPPEDRMVYKVYPLTDNMKAAQKSINGLRASGGGDEPEAVLDGVLAACRELHWRAHARRVAVLVGDAPPHGVGCRGDSFRNGCPCGETIERVTAAAEEQRVTLYALGLTHTVRDSFGRLSRFTGGEYFQADHGDEAIKRLQQILTDEFGEMEFDQRVMACWSEGLREIDDVAGRLESSRPVVSRSLSRLGARELLA